MLTHAERGARGGAATAAKYAGTDHYQRISRLAAPVLLAKDPDHFRKLGLKGGAAKAVKYRKKYL